MDDVKISKVFLATQIAIPLIVMTLINLAGMPGDAAGWFFIFLGLFMFSTMVIRKFLINAPLFWLNFLFTILGIALIAAHSNHLGQNMSSYAVYGIQASILHHLIELLFVAVFLGTLFEIFKQRSQKAFEQLKGSL